MTIPKHDDIRAPALALLAERGQLRLAEFEVPLAEHFSLAAAELIAAKVSGIFKI